MYLGTEASYWVVAGVAFYFLDFFFPLNLIGGIVYNTSFL